MEKDNKELRVKDKESLTLSWLITEATIMMIEDIIKLLDEFKIEYNKEKENETV